jgi:hypothetical protein
MNRKRLALSAFVVGAIATPTALHRWSDWLAIYPGFHQALISQYIRDRDNHSIEIEAYLRNIDRRTKGIEAANKAAGLKMLPPSAAVDSSYLPDISRPAYDGPPNTCFPSSIQGYIFGTVAGARALLPWLRAFIVGGAISAVAGYLLPTIYRVVYIWVPSLAVSYIRWLNGPHGT